MQKLAYGIMLLVVLAAQPAFAQEAKVITSQDKRNYEIGVQLVRVLSRLGGEINLDMVIKGMRDALKDENLIARGGSMQEAAKPARVQSLSRDQLRAAETGRAGADAAARMTISGGAGRITATPGQPAYNAGRYDYRYQGFARTR